MKTVTLMTHEYPPLTWGGSGNTARLLVKNLAEREFNVNVITLKYGPYKSLPTVERIKNVTIVRLPISDFFWKYYKPSLCYPYKALAFTLQNSFIKKSSLIHSLNFRDTAFILKGNVPLISNVNDYYSELVGWNPFKYPFQEQGKLLKYLNHHHFKFMSAVNIRRSDHLVFNSQFTFDVFEKKYGIKEKSSIVYKGIDPAEYGLKREKDIDILFIASRFEVKGAKELIFAVSRLKKFFPGIKCVMIGRYSYVDVDYQGLIRKLGLEKNITIFEHQPHEKIPEFYARSKVFFMGSYFEAFGQTLLEALAAEVPVVATRVGGIPEIVDEDVGILIPQRDVDASVRALHELLDDDKKRKKLGKNGRKRVLEKFTVGKMCEQYLKIYERYL